MSSAYSEASAQMNHGAKRPMHAFVMHFAHHHLKKVAREEI